MRGYRIKSNLLHISGKVAVNLLQDNSQLFMAESSQIQLSAVSRTQNIVVTEYAETWRK